MESRGDMNHCVRGSLNPKQPELLGLEARDSHTFSRSQGEGGYRV